MADDSELQVLYSFVRRRAIRRLWVAEIGADSPGTHAASEEIRRLRDLVRDAERGLDVASTLAYLRARAVDDRDHDDFPARFFTDPA